MADQQSEKRNSSDGMMDDRPGGDGVGARHGSTAPPQAGGGYLDICTEQDSCFGPELQLRELREMGLPRTWLEVARALGPRRFLVVWRLLDREEHLKHGRLLLRLPRFSLYRRRQRNLYIQALAAEGLSAREIRSEVQQQLGERISVKHICRLMKA